MPFVLIVSGAVLLTAAVRNTQQWLYFMLAKDFTGPDNFIYWFASILIIGAVGYIPRMKPISDGFLILVILVLFLRKGSGFFDQFNAAIGVTQKASPEVSAPTQGPTGSTGSTGSTAQLGTPCTYGIDPGCGRNGRYGGPGVTPPTVIFGPGSNE